MFPGRCITTTQCSLLYANNKANNIFIQQIYTNILLKVISKIWFHLYSIFHSQLVSSFCLNETTCIKNQHNAPREKRKNIISRKKLLTTEVSKRPRTLCQRRKASTTNITATTAGTSLPYYRTRYSELYQQVTKIIQHAFSGASHVATQLQFSKQKIHRLQCKNKRQFKYSIQRYFYLSLYKIQLTCNYLP